MFSINKTCNDLFFSGHSISLSISFYIWFYYNNLKNIILKLFFNFLFLIIYIIGLFIFIISHFHYSIDVLIGSILSIFLFSIYHLLISNSSLLTKGSTNISLIIKIQYFRFLVFYLV